MKFLGASMAGVWVAIGLMAAPAFAQRPPPARPCCSVPAGTLVEVELAEPVSTKVQKTGEQFELRLAQPLVVNGRVVLQAGTLGVGDVVESSRPGMGGKSAKLVLAARYLSVRGRRLPLQSLQLAAAGHDNTLEAQAAGVGGIAFGPLGFVGLAVPGGNVTFPEGTAATARLAYETFLPSMGPASRSAAYASAELNGRAGADATDEGAIRLPPPPPGMGQVVFFRPKSVLGTGQWFKVREAGAELGKLDNGAYFVQVTPPGLHTYTAKTEPEVKDHLTLQVDPGETYFVEGILTKGLVIGEADLTPSDRLTFDKASAKLKLAPPPGAPKDDKDDLSKYPRDDSANSAH